LRRESGFTLMEVLIALIIASMATVALGYLVAGTGRVHTEAQALEIAAQHGDRLLEYAALYGTTDHPDIRSALNRLRQKHWSVTLETVPEARNPALQRIRLLLDHTALRQSITLQRIIFRPTPAPLPGTGLSTQPGTGSYNHD